VDSGEPSTAAYYEQLMQLPGLQRQLRLAAQERAGLPDLDAEPEHPDRLARFPRKPEPKLDEWDLRARMEKRRRQERELAGERVVGMRGGAGRVCRFDQACEDTPLCV
jgi:hypothetical protein